MDPKDQPQFNPKIPISEVLKQEQEGFVPSAPKLNDVVSAISNMYESTKSPATATPMPDVASLNKTLAGTNAGAAPIPSQVKIIKTYKSDAAEAVKRQEQASVAKIAIAQEVQRREQGEEIGVEAPKRKFGLLITAIILIALGAAAIPTVQYILNLKKQEVPVSAEKTIIPFNQQEKIVLENATRNNLLEALDTIKTKQLATANIEYRKIFEKVQDVNDKTKTVDKEIAPDIFAGLIGPNMPSALARSFDSDYMYGTQDSRPFILFRTSSYQQTFANMLRWETKMITDLNPVLNLNAEALGQPFTDQVVINKDIRAVTAADGTIVFLYGFLDNQTLIITTNTQTFEDINSRYVAAHFVQ